jgi:hypothetical protein
MCPTEPVTGLDSMMPPPPPAGMLPADSGGCRRSVDAGTRYYAGQRRSVRLRFNAGPSKVCSGGERFLVLPGHLSSFCCRHRRRAAAAAATAATAADATAAAAPTAASSSAAAANTNTTALQSTPTQPHPPPMLLTQQWSGAFAGGG